MSAETTINLRGIDTPTRYFLVMLGKLAEHCGPPPLASCTVATADRFVNGVHFDPASMAEITEQAKHLHLLAGETLIRQGEREERMYVILNGRLRITRQHPSGSVVHLGELKAGDVVGGEMALLAGEPRSATVRAVRDSELLSLTREGFQSWISRHPEALLQVSRLLVRRLRRSYEERPVCGAVRTIAVVPAHPNLPLTPYVKALATALAIMGKVRQVNSQARAAGMGHGIGYSRSEMQVSLGAWLSELERQHDFVLCQADAEITDWTRFCLRQADRVIIVAENGRNPAPSTLEAISQASPSVVADSRIEMLWVQNRAVASPHTVGYGRGLGWAHHHVRYGNRLDWERAARLIVGRARGLVLGGGGARGFAHVGVVRALREAGIAFDVVGGVSMGAIVAGAVAIGWDDEKIHHNCREWFLGRKSPFDYTFPVIALTRGARIAKSLRRHCEDAHIEDLPYRYFCVSSNLMRLDQKVHREGPLWRAIRASFSLPGILPPLHDDGEILIDGGFVTGEAADPITCDFRNRERLHRPQRFLGYFLGLPVTAEQTRKTDQQSANQRRHAAV